MQNSSTAPNLMRSANEPTISAQVMPANVAWKATNTSSGIITPSVKVAASESMVMPMRKALSRLPMIRPAPPKARLYPYTAQSTTMSENTTITCISTDSMFLLRTSPP